MPFQQMSNSGIWRPKDDKTGKKAFVFRLCEFCRKRFWAKQPHARFCSLKCRVAFCRKKKAIGI